MTLYIQVLALFLLNNYSSETPQEIDSAADQKIVEAAVVNWADASFLEHMDYKFEHFKTHYTDDYFIQTMRIEMHTEKIEDLKTQKANGTYTGSEENYQKDIEQLSTTVQSAKATLEKIDRVSHYETHFWTNIQTNDGITVYYELIVRLDNDYNVSAAIENSSIGKKSGETKIAYKKTFAGIRVTEKH